MSADIATLNTAIRAANEPAVNTTVESTDRVAYRSTIFAAF
jgi:hypothetical protein